MWNRPPTIVGGGDRPGRVSQGRISIACLKPVGAAPRDGATEIMARPRTASTAGVAGADASYLQVRQDIQMSADA